VGRLEPGAVLVQQSETLSLYREVCVDVDMVMERDTLLKTERTCCKMQDGSRRGLGASIFGEIWQKRPGGCGARLVSIIQGPLALTSA